MFQVNIQINNFAKFSINYLVIGASKYDPCALFEDS